MSSDQSLIVRIRQGDEEAASQIYDRYCARIFGLVRSRMNEHLRSQTQPEDIVQSVFKSIFRGVSAGGYDAPEGGTLWQLMAIVAIHKVRRNATRRQADKRDSRRNESISELENFDLPATTPPEQFESAIRESMEGLKPIEQSVALLRVQGYTVEEISQTLSRSKRSVERTLQTVRDKLSQALDF